MARSLAGGRGQQPQRSTSEDVLAVERTVGVDKEALEDSTSSLIVEVLGRGNLHSWICKMGQGGQFSDKVLWLIFDCLFKGVVGMAYPPERARKEEYDRTGGRWGRTHFDQEIPKQKKELKESNHLIHFDLDPTNSKSLLFFSFSSMSPLISCLPT